MLKLSFTMTMKLLVRKFTIVTELILTVVPHIPSKDTVYQIIVYVYILGEPDISCGYGVVHFHVHTVKGEASQVYVKGNSDNPDCVFHNTGNVTIDLSKCNIRRKREANPSGITYAMTVIVQLHPVSYS